MLATAGRRAARCARCFRRLARSIASASSRSRATRCAAGAERLRARSKAAWRDGDEAVVPRARRRASNRWPRSIRAARSCAKPACCSRDATRRCTRWSRGCARGSSTSSAERFANVNTPETRSASRRRSRDEPRAFDRRVRAGEARHCGRRRLAGARFQGGRFDARLHEERRRRDPARSRRQRIHRLRAFVGTAACWATPIPQSSRRSAPPAARGTSFGAPTEAESELAEIIISMLPSIERLRFVSSGTEATMSAIRLARGYHAIVRRS